MKLMNHLLTAIALIIVSVISHAQTGTNWQKPKKAGAIKRNLAESVNWKGLQCKGTEDYEGANRDISAFISVFAKNAIENAQVVLAKTDGTQPVLYFKYNEKKTNNDHESTEVYVTTTADPKTLTHIDLERNVTSKILENRGSLEQPDLKNVRLRTVRITGSCP